MQEKLENDFDLLIYATLYVRVVLLTVSIDFVLNSYYIDHKR